MALILLIQSLLEADMSIVSYFFSSFDIDHKTLSCILVSLLHCKLLSMCRGPVCFGYKHRRGETRLHRSMKELICNSKESHNFHSLLKEEE